MKIVLCLLVLLPFVTPAPDPRQLSTANFLLNAVLKLLDLDHLTSIVQGILNEYGSNEKEAQCEDGCHTSVNKQFNVTTQHSLNTIGLACCPMICHSKDGRLNRRNSSRYIGTFNRPIPRNSFEVTSKLQSAAYFYIASIFDGIVNPTSSKTIYHMAINVLGNQFLLCNVKRVVLMLVRNGLGRYFLWVDSDRLKFNSHPIQISRICSPFPLASGNDDNCCICLKNVFKK